MVYSSQEREHIPGAKARLVAGLDVRDKSRTYLRNKSNNCPGRPQKAEARTVRADLRKQKQELPGLISETKVKTA